MAKYEENMKSEAIQQFIDEAASKGACDAGMRWFFLASKQCFLFGDFVAWMVESPEFTPLFLLWCILNFSDEVSTGIRNQWIHGMVGNEEVKVAIQKHYLPSFTSEELSVLKIN